MKFDSAGYSYSTPQVYEPPCRDVMLAGAAVIGQMSCCVAVAQKATATEVSYKGRQNQLDFYRDVIRSLSKRLIIYRRSELID